jgi:hypothetical protein
MSDSWDSYQGRVLRVLAHTYEGEEFKDTLVLPAGFSEKNELLSYLSTLSHQFGFNVPDFRGQSITITWDHLPTDDEMGSLRKSLAESYSGVKYNPSIWR